MADDDAEYHDETDAQERTAGGDPVYRYDDAGKPFEVALPADSAEAVAAAYERHLGEPAGVFHELVSHLVHLDVHYWPPTPERDCWVYATTGMSDRPMPLPPGATPGEVSPYAELMVCLPADWPWKGKNFQVVPPAPDAPADPDGGDPEGYWPIGWMKFLARFPHEHDAFLGWGHTIPNGDPAEPFDAATGFCGSILMPSLHVPQDLWSVTAEGKDVNVLAVWPLYAEEMSFKLRKGADALIGRFERAGVTDRYDVGRENVCKGGGIGGRLRSIWPFGGGG